MQYLLLAGLSFGAAAITLWVTQSWLAAPRSRKENIRLGLLAAGLNAIGTILFEGLIKAGRPTFYYHTHAPGPVTLRIFFGGVMLASLVFGLAGYLWETKFQKRPVSQKLQPGLLRMVWLSLLIAAIVELFVFNFRHFELTGFEEKPAVVFERGDFHLYGFYFNRASQKLTTYDQREGSAYGFAIYPGNMKIRNVQLPVLNDQPETRVIVNYTDSAYEFYRSTEEHMLLPAVPDSYTIPLHTIGKTYKIEFIFPDVTGDEITEISVDQVKINQLIPLAVLPYRVALTFLLVFLAFFFAPHSPFYALPLTFRSAAQRFALGIMLTAVILVFGWTVFSNYSNTDLPIDEVKDLFFKGADQYNQLVSALEVPRYSLEKIPDKSIQSAWRPYDISFRQHYNVQYEWDTVYFEGKYYVYFGVVPAVTLLLPWKLATGSFMPLDYAVLIFSSLGILGLYGLYSRLILRVFPKISFSLYSAGFIMIVTASGLTWCLRRALPYELAITSGFCFAVWAVFLGWLAFEKRHNRWLFSALLFGSGSAAGLAVGCRPTQFFILLILILIPGCFLRNRQDWLNRKNFTGLLAFGIPYGLIGLALMKYNYERFGNVFEFGIRYQLTVANQFVSTVRLGLSGVLQSVAQYLFTPATLDWEFPFLHLSWTDIPYNGQLDQFGPMIGLFAFPLFFWLFTLVLFRNQLKAKNIFPLVVGLITVALLILTFSSLFSVSYRYTVDFNWLFSLPAVFLMLMAAIRFSEHGLQRWFYAAVQISLLICIGLFIVITITGENEWFMKVNPDLYNQIAYAFTIWK